MALCWLALLCGCRFRAEMAIWYRLTDQRPANSELGEPQRSSGRLMFRAALLGSSTRIVGRSQRNRKRLR